MNTIKQVRLVLAVVLFIFGGFISSATSIDPINEKKQYEYLKKAKYFEIRAQLEAGEITLEEAQARWQKALEKIQKQQQKEEAK